MMLTDGFALSDGTILADGIALTEGFALTDGMALTDGTMLADGIAHERDGFFYVNDFLFFQFPNSNSNQHERIKKRLVTFSNVSQHFDSI